MLTFFLPNVSCVLHFPYLLLHNQKFTTPSYFVLKKGEHSLYYKLNITLNLKEIGSITYQKQMYYL